MQIPRDKKRTADRRPQTAIRNSQFATIQIIGLLVVLLISACGSRSTSESVLPAQPTRTPIPTFTPTPRVPQATTAGAESAPNPAQVQSAATATPAPAAQPTPTQETPPPPTTEPILTVAQETVNVRAGPGTNYPVIGQAAGGATYPITGRNPAGDWWQVCCINGSAGWLFAPLVAVENAESVAVAAEIPPPPVVEAPTALPVAETAPPDSPAPAAPTVAETGPAQTNGTAGNFDPAAQYQIVHYRVLGFDDNNGGIFNKGGQQIIFLTVLDQNGAGIDGAVVKDAVGDKLNVVTGSKGPGKAEIKMDWDPYKLYVASDPSGPVSSQISNQMNNPHPHLPDVIGKLGPPDNEYAVCPTPDVNCSPPFFTIHFSYEITFQRVR